MPLLRIGVDLVEVARIERGVQRHGERFYKRFFTPQEVEFCNRSAARLAGRFAIKEAVGKAFGTGIGDVSWQEIEVICDARGRPFLDLRGKAKALADQMGLTTWEISLSHTDTHAIGFVVAMGETDKESRA